MQLESLFMTIIILLIISVLTGAFLGKYFSNRESLAKSLLVFSAGFLITICLNEVFPEVYHSQISHIGLFVIGGVLLQMILEGLTKGFEHGHFHHHTHIIPFALMMGLFIHAFIEGIPLANESRVFSPYLLGILVHNIPISFILGVYLFKEKVTKSGILIITLFSLSSPLGMFFGHYFNPVLQPYFLAVVGGIFLHISAVIIFESNQSHQVNWNKIFLVILGVALGTSVHFLG